ncbi:YdeI/OmpD-associated family protein [Andreprevotia chitinilytica]|uniref:YdeI/OmpD-associated family protein n=1 Tax=Andreprevotia chitinilytica TaxID=396808 RepID=UPI000555F155|nr:YdeI/OmpD-associated family protein [Andreprevotia chitinilytica]
MGNTLNEQPILQFEHQDAWQTWLAENHATSTGLWLRLAKKGADQASVSYAEAIEVALCYGWIDGQKKPDNAHYWLQKFTPRSAKSIWSQINRDKALALIESGRMMPAGQREIERAQSDGRWQAAYASASQSTVPDDFQQALDANATAKAFFATLDRQNRFAMLFRIQTVKKAETRARKIQQFVQMLEKHEKLYP